MINTMLLSSHAADGNRGRDVIGLCSLADICGSHDLIIRSHTTSDLRGRNISRRFALNLVPVVAKIHK